MNVSRKNERRSEPLRTVGRGTESLERGKPACQVHLRSSARPELKMRGGERRSPCPVSCTLDLIGDRWTLLVVRDLLLGRTRFKEFRGSPEGIPTNILSERLERLTAAGLIEQRPVEAGGKRMAYALTDSGSALRGVMMSMREWGLRFIPGTSARMKRACSASCAASPETITETITLTGEGTKTRRPVARKGS